MHTARGGVMHPGWWRFVAVVIRIADLVWGILHTVWAFSLVNINSQWTITIGSTSPFLVLNKTALT